MRKLLNLLLVGGYIAMALLTGLSRNRECAPGQLVFTKSESPIVSVAMGLAWPYMLYQHISKTGTTERFFHRTGVLCSPAAP